jgi:hypothetical protein
MTSVLDRETVEKVAACYPPREQAKDNKVFSDDFRAPFVARGFLELEELLKIAHWKAHRAKGYIRRNDPERVQAVTGQAFAEEDPCLSVRLLDHLHGIGVPMASAILTVWKPDTFTVIDVNAWASLRRLGLLPRLTRPDSSFVYPETYPPYLQLCQKIATDLAVPLRTLDKCLWTLNGETPEEFLSMMRLRAL